MLVKLTLVSLLATLSLATNLQYPAKNPCILINLKAQNDLIWDDNGTKVPVPTWGFSDSHVIDGSCSEPKPYLEVKWDIDNATMKFEFDKSGNKAMVDMTLSFVPSIVFGKSNNTDNDTVEVSVTYKLGTASKAFKCNAQQVEMSKKGDYSMTIRISDLMIQGFDVKDGKFSDYEECSVDPVPEVLDKVTMNATDNGTTCAMVAGKFKFMIQYTMKNNKTNTSTIDIPKDGLVSKGNCSLSKENTLEAMFYDKFSVMFDFRGDENSFWLRSITLNYPLGSPNFPNSSLDTEQTATIMFDDSKKQYKAALSGSYMCNADFELALNNSVTLHVSDFQYAALQKNITDFKDSNISECSADAKTSSIVPIAVGAALAGLVVIVLIAYLIGRRRNRKGYESV